MKLKQLAALCGLVIILMAAGVIESSIRSSSKSAYAVGKIKSINIQYKFHGMAPAEDNTYEIKCTTEECIATGQESVRQMGGLVWEQRSVPAKSIPYDLIEAMANSLVKLESANGPRSFQDICRENVCVSHAFSNLPFCEAFQCILYTDSFPEYKLTITTTNQIISVSSTGAVWNFKLENHWYTQITGEFSKAYYQIIDAIRPK